MSRDSAETGDPDTLQGQFPSEIEGEASGGGGGGGASAPELVEEPVIGKWTGGRGSGNYIYKGIAWDSRPLGGTRNGFYITGTSFPFQQTTTSLATNMGGPAGSAGITGTMTLTADFILGPSLSVELLSVATTITDISVDASFQWTPTAPFTTFNTGVMENFYIDGISFPTGTNLYWGKSFMQLAQPAPYVSYGFGTQQVQWQTDPGFFRNIFPLFNPYRRQIFPVPGDSTTVQADVAFNWNDNSVGYQYALRIHGFNTSDLDNMTSVGTNV